MPKDWMTQVGTIGTFAILLIFAITKLIREVKASKNGNGNAPGTETVKDIKSISIDTNDRVKGLHELHSKTDGDGVAMVYFPRSVVEVIKESAKAQERTAGHMKDMTVTQKQINDNQRQMAETLITIKDKVS